MPFMAPREARQSGRRESERRAKVQPAASSRRLQLIGIGKPKDGGSFLLSADVGKLRCKGDASMDAIAFRTAPGPLPQQKDSLSSSAHHASGNRSNKLPQRVTTVKC
jgi:hypothetical protein